MKDKGHHTRLERQRERKRECKISFISEFLFWYFSSVFLRVWNVFIVIDDYYSELSRFG